MKYEINLIFEKEFNNEKEINNYLNEIEHFLELRLKNINYKLIN
jgi:hypothetical protein